MPCCRLVHGSCLKAASDCNTFGYVKTLVDGHLLKPRIRIPGMERLNTSSRKDYMTLRRVYGPYTILRVYNRIWFGAPVLRFIWSLRVSPGVQCRNTSPEFAANSGPGALQQP